MRAFAALQRQLAALVPGAGLPGAAGDGPSLEAFSSAVDLPRLISAAMHRGRIASRATSCRPERRSRFRAFLDGTQESRVLALRRTGVPVIYGTVGGGHSRFGTIGG